MNRDNKRVKNIIRGKFSNNQIQQNVDNSAQGVKVYGKKGNEGNINKYIEMLSENIHNIGLDATQIEDIERSMAQINKVRGGEVNKYRDKISNILEGATGSLMAAGLLHALSKINI